MTALKDAINALNDRLIDAHAIGEALDLSGGESAPAWVQVFCTQVECIREAAEAVETLVNPQKARTSGAPLGVSRSRVSHCGRGCSVPQMPPRAMNK